MLSDHERQTLREIQRQLLVDDPDFEQSFRALELSTPTPTATPPPQHRWAYTVVIVIAALLAVLMLVAGSAGGTLAFAVIAGSVGLVQHFEHTAGQRKRGD